MRRCAFKGRPYMFIGCNRPHLDGIGSLKEINGNTYANIDKTGVIKRLGGEVLGYYNEIMLLDKEE